ncbi:MAG: uridylate kinase [Parcubacteria group bacterium Gr01-1014_70]|nr:MAG: uridylate kinase [Parcubacteria group bacterium Gr01-1014_70]
MVYKREMKQEEEYSLYLLKLTGEALVENGDHFSVTAAEILAEEIQAVVADPHIRLAIVVGGGNIVRGTELAAKGINREIADYMGMLATVQNALLLEDRLEKREVPARTMVSITMNKIAEPYIYKRALRHINKGRVVILSGGIGVPRVSTDFAAVQRACELGASAILKGTKVDGIYDKDPKKYKDAEFISDITYDEVIQKRLRVMDDAAFSHAREQFMRPTYIFNIFKKGNLQRVVQGERIGSVIRP